MTTAPSHNSVIPDYWEYPLIHYHQKYDWDCGISCILMILSRQERAHFIANFDAICSEEGFGQSTWTIDLCYLLKRFRRKHKFTTKLIGINSRYSKTSYYERNLKKDEQRILHKFQHAQSNDIIVEQKTVKYGKLIEHLGLGFGCIILLINAPLLTCDLCKANKLSKELRSCFPVGPTYAGHYIILCGFNRNQNKFFYRNPTYVDRVCVTSFDDLDEARMSFGTDEDVIFLFDQEAESFKI